MLDDDGGVMLTVELQNEKPVDLIVLTKSLTSLAESFREYADEHTGDPATGNLRLYIRQMRSGSVIADLVALTEQAQWLVEHAEVLGGFVANINDVVGYLLGRASSVENKPSRSEIKRVAQIVDPVAQDSGAQLNIVVSDQASLNVTNNFHIHSLEANALQNRARNELGPDLPATFIERSRFMVLAQIKNDPNAATGDRAIIPSISDAAVKLRFLTPEAKKQVLELPENPLQKAFRVDVEVNAIDGKPVLYQLLQVHEALDRPG